MLRIVPMLVLATFAAPAWGSPPGLTLPDARCDTPPGVRSQGFRHTRSRIIAGGAPNHRGIDLLASEDDAQQRISGKLAHGLVDKDLEDEDAEVFACMGTGWRSLGTGRTDDDGRFEIILHGAGRLGVGLRDMYVVSRGDGTGAYFVGYVAPRGRPVIVTDIDGTISWSENSIVRTVVLGEPDIPPRPHAAHALAMLPHPIVYMTSRGDVLLELTRQWLHRHGFPRGLLRHSNGLFVRPGSSSIRHKTVTLGALSVPIAAAIGNRNTDIIAYRQAGLKGTQIFIHLPEYESEVRSHLDAGLAVGFADYRTLPDLIARLVGLSHVRPHPPRQ